MPYALVLQFSKVTSTQYDAVNKQMGIEGNRGDFPKTLVSHVAGATSGGGWCVVELWDSQADQEQFLKERLMPAFAKVGGLPQPTVTPIQVHNTYQRP